MNYAGLTEVLQLATLFYPFTRTTFAILSLSSTTLLLLPSVACSSYFQSALFSFQGADFQPLSRSDRNICLQVLRSNIEPGSINVLFAYFFFQEKVSGGPKWTRTTDLTIISRAL